VFQCKRQVNGYGCFACPTLTTCDRNNQWPRASLKVLRSLVSAALVAEIFRARTCSRLLAALLRRTAQRPVRGSRYAKYGVDTCLGKKLLRLLLPYRRR